MLTLKKGSEACKDILKAGLVPNVLGSPGVGKSDMVNQIAEAFGLYVIDFRAAQSDPTDFNGFPTMNEDRTRSYYAPPMTFPLENDSIPEGYSGWLLFFDELNTSPPMVQAAAYKVLLDRMVGQQHLHKKVAMVCAGNLETDKAITQRLSTAMQSRLITIEVKPDVNEWCEWAQKNGVDHRIVAYVQWRPDNLHAFNANHSDFTFPCPRTYKFASNLFDVWGNTIGIDKLEILKGTVGPGVAAELITFCDIFQDLPTRQQMIDDPDTVLINSSQLDILHAITGIIAKEFDTNSSESLLKIINKMPVEFQVVTVNGILRRDVNMKEEVNLKPWIRTNAARLY